MFLLLSCVFLRSVVAEQPLVEDPCRQEPWHVQCLECPLDVVVLPACVGYDDGMQEALDIAFDDFGVWRATNPSTDLQVSGP